MVPFRRHGPYTLFPLTSLSTDNRGKTFVVDVVLNMNDEDGLQTFTGVEVPPSHRTKVRLKGPVDRTTSFPLVRPVPGDSDVWSGPTIRTHGPIEEVQVTGHPGYDTHY